MARGRLSRNPPQRGQAGGTEAKRGQSHGFGVPRGQALPCSERWPWGCPWGGQSSKGRAGRCLAPKGWKSSPHAKAHTALELGRVSFAPRCRAESRNLRGSAGFASSAISGGGRVAKTLIFPHFGVREGGAQEAEPCSTAGGGCALPPPRGIWGLVWVCSGRCRTAGGLLGDFGLKSEKAPNNLKFSSPFSERPESFGAGRVAPCVPRGSGSG